MGEEGGCWRISGKVTPIKPLMSILSYVNHTPFFSPLGTSIPLGEQIIGPPRISRGLWEPRRMVDLICKCKKLADA